MPYKCESCRFYKPHPFYDRFERGWCEHIKVRRRTIYDQPGVPKPIETARNLCDREGDGIFVHFEPRDPATGAAFDQEFCTDEITGNCSCTSCTARDCHPCEAPPVQITREPKTLAMSAGGAR